MSRNLPYMISLRLILVIFILVISPIVVWAQASVESIPNLETSTTFLRPNFLNKYYNYFIFASLGAIVISSGIWYNIYSRKHQHPYKFLETTEKSASRLLEEGKIDEAKELLTQALYIIENDPIKFPAKCQSRNGAIWMLKRKIEDLNELLIDN